MSGVVIVSLDCEGLWGLAEAAPTWKSQIHDESLSWAYRTVFEILRRNDVKATAAFVGLFSLPPEEVRGQLEELSESPARRRWLRHALEDFRAGRTSGWRLPDGALDSAARAGHEVATHTYTHLPLGDPDVTEQDAVFEIEKSRQWGQHVGYPVRTVVFPRNQAPSRPLIAAATELEGYRLPIPSRGRVSRVLDEFNVVARSAQPVVSAKPVPIPGDTILNWRHGPRKMVPPAATVRRWSSILDHAAENNGVAHMWLHPHNLITGRRQAQLFDRCMSEVAKRIRGGRLSNLSQLEYAICQSEQTVVG